MSQEIFKVAQMLQIQGIPSRQNLIALISTRGTQVVEGNPEIKTLFDLIESEESPFKISKDGSAALASALAKNPALAKYEQFIKKTLAIRILQKSKNFFTNIRFKALEKQLAFFGSWEKIESLLYECNRVDLVRTMIDHQNLMITFDQEIQVAENLRNFGNKLREVFQAVSYERMQGMERSRIFMKVKEKLDEETEKVQQRKEAMFQNKASIERDLNAEMAAIEALRDKEAAEKKREFELEKQRNEQQMKRNELLEALNTERQFRAREVLQELQAKGIKKIKTDKISDLEKEDELNYDQIMTFYSNLLRKEREAFEITKNKKLNDVEIWVKARKEEESKSLKKYCDEHGAKEMQQIQKAIEDRHAKELNSKKQLETARLAHDSFKAKVMAQRMQQLEEKRSAYVKKLDFPPSKIVFDAQFAENSK